MASSQDQKMFILIRFDADARKQILGIFSSKEETIRQAHQLMTKDLEYQLHEGIKYVFETFPLDKFSGTIETINMYDGEVVDVITDDNRDLLNTTVSVPITEELITRPQPKAAR